jgi:hypothetical protein
LKKPLGPSGPGGFFVAPHDGRRTVLMDDAPNVAYARTRSIGTTTNLADDANPTT